jgi:hypothetical protein
MNAFFALILAGLGLGQASPYFSLLSTAKGAATRVYQVHWDSSTFKLWLGCVL